jgi:hypothetical protein
VCLEEVEGKLKVIDGSRGRGEGGGEGKKKEQFWMFKLCNIIRQMERLEKRPAAIGTQKKKRVVETEEWR